MLWELAVVVFDIPAFELPPPSRILEAIADDPSFYLRNAWVTGREAMLGFALALLLALLAGTVMTYSRFLERAVQPVAVLIQVTPIIAYAPAFVIWLGAGIKPIIAITTLVCFVPFLFNAVAGLRSVDPATLEVLRSVNANGREIFWRLRLPHALPYLFAAARIAVGLALIGAVLGEWFALVDEGLGVAIRKALNFNDVDQLWGSILVLGFLGGSMLLAPQPRRAGRLALAPVAGHALRSMRPVRSLAIVLDRHDGPAGVRPAATTSDDGRRRTTVTGAGTTSVAGAGAVTDEAISPERCEANKAAGTITYLSSFDFAATPSIVDVVMADKQGYFDALCLDVDMKSSFSTANYPLVAANQAQFSSAGSYTELLRFAKDGARLVARRRSTASRTSAPCWFATTAPSPS